MKKIFYASLFLFIFIYLFSSLLNAQESDSSAQTKKLEVSAGIDVYYTFSSDKNNNPEIYPAVSSYINEFRLNLARVSLKYNYVKTRGLFTIHYGDIPEINWKPYTKFDFIQEANIGFSPVKNLWVDAGFFQTHLGIEGWPADNFLSSNALVSVSEPSIQSGVRVMYDFSDKVSAGIHILNGFGIYEDNNKNKTFGVQIIYNISNSVQFNYNNLIGNEMPAGVAGKVRQFHNFIVTGNPFKKLEYQAELDIGSQENSKLQDSNSTAYLYGGLLSLRYHFNPQISLTLRGDYYQDLDGILSGLINDKTGLKGNGVNLGFEYKPVEKSYVRLEYGFLRLDDSQRVFYNNDNQRHSLTLSFGLVY